MKSPTEAVHPRAARLGPLQTRALLQLMAAEDQKALAAVARLVPRVAQVAAQVADALGRGGRLVYLGAGTSGRLATLDAAECPPTFGSEKGQVVALMAGGPRALTRAVEGAEDDAAAGRRAVEKARVGARDVVVGISASGQALWVKAGLARARALGAVTVFLTCNPAAARSTRSDFTLTLATGPEVLAGSTRLKAAAATRSVLAMISTGAFTRLGRTRGGRMIALAPTNRKLIARAARTVAALTGVEVLAARRALARSGGSVERALDLLGSATGVVR